MTTTYDPFDAPYWDEGDLREELTRVYDLCHGCRLCFKFCDAFPTLFELIDRHEDQDAAKLTKHEQDAVVDDCFNCKLCFVNCPYTPGQHEWAIDFPRLMLRAEAVLHEETRRPPRAFLTDQFLGRTDLMGKVATGTPVMVNRMIGSPGSLPRKLMEKTVGIASERILPPYARQRFSTWFRKRTQLRFAEKQGNVALFPTCLVEYQDAGVGKDLVRVLERNGVECSLPEGQICCGAPWLHQGDVDGFRRNAKTNVAVLAKAVREGNDVVVPQPTCSYVLKNDYPDYVRGADADLVAANTYDAAEYLMKLHKGDGTSLDTDFSGPVPSSVTYHAPCHLRAQNIGLKSRDLLKLTGTKVTVVAECSGIDGTWGLRAEHIESSRGVAKKMANAINKAGNDVVAGDCSLAHVAIVQETGKSPVHPVQLFARAYGIPEEEAQP
ncbi:MAG: glycerol-3-phosphate dehydrogenase subunit [Acidimicrobiaceae bacterium]